MKCKFFLEFPASRVFAVVSAPRGVSAGGEGRGGEKGLKEAEGGTTPA